MEEVLKENPAISVIIPVYKVEPYFERCLQSVRNQTFGNIEIILVDDGSPDNCPALCDAAAAEDARIRVIHQKNSGLSAARNAGIEAARAPWLMFVDSDDIVLPSFCEKALEMVTRSGADLAAFRWQCFVREGDSFPEQDQLYEEGLYEKEAALQLLAEGYVWDYAWNKIYRRELFDDVRYPVGEIWEDVGTTYLLFAAAGRIWLSREVLYEYRLRCPSLSRGMTYSQAIEGIFRQRERAYLFYEEHYPVIAERIEAAFTNQALDFCMYRCRNRHDSWFREVQKRVLARHPDRQALGWKVWIKVQLLRFPFLFWLATADRRRRKRRKDKENLEQKGRNGKGIDQNQRDGTEIPPSY